MKPNKQQDVIITMIHKLMVGYCYEIVVTTSKEHLLQIVAENKEKEVRIYGIGGDGFIHYLIQNMVHSKAELVILPNGTGNDFSRSCNQKKDIKQIIVNSLNQEAILIDTMKANNISMINSFCFAIDSETAAFVHRYKRLPLLPSSLQYAYVLLRRLMHYKFYPIHIYNDHFEYCEPVIIGAICNGNYYGGGFNICPQAKLDDGYFNMTLIKGLTKRSIPKHFLLVSRQKLYLSKSVTERTDTQITLETNNEVNIDGEVYPSGTYHIEIVPKSIYIVKG